MTSLRTGLAALTLTALAVSGCADEPSGDGGATATAPADLCGMLQTHLSGQTRWKLSEVSHDLTRNGGTAVASCSLAGRSMEGATTLDVTWRAATTPDVARKDLEGVCDEDVRPPEEFVPGDTRCESVRVNEREIPDGHVVRAELGLDAPGVLVMTFSTEVDRFKPTAPGDLAFFGSAVRGDVDGLRG